MWIVALPANVAPTVGSHVHLGNGAFLGGGAAFHQFVRVGAHAFIANNAGVTRDVPPYIIAAGQPAAPRSVNTEGLKRRGFDATQIRNIKDAFRTLYRSGMGLEEAREQIAGLAAEQAELDIFAAFLVSSDRSIVR